MKTTNPPIARAALLALLIGSGAPLFAQSAADSESTSPGAGTRAPSKRNVAANEHDRSQTELRNANSQPVTVTTIDANADTNANTNLSTQMPATTQGFDQKTGKLLSEIRGMDIHNRQGDKLGTIRDVVIDSRSGKAAYFVVSAGGLAGVNQTLRAVPIQALNHERVGEDDRIVLDLDKPRWEQAPALERGQITSLPQDGGTIHQFYGQTWRDDSRTTDSSRMTDSSRTTDSTAARPRNGSDTTRDAADRSASKDDKQGLARTGESLMNQSLVLASDVNGAKLRNGTQEVGKVDDIVLNLDSRQAAALVDPNDRYASVDGKFLVPFSRITRGSDDRYSTTLTSDDFTQAGGPGIASTFGNRPDAVQRWSPDARREDRQTSGAE